MNLKKPSTYYRFVVLILCFLPGLIQGQQPTTDSLLRALASAPADTGKVWLYCNLGRQLYASETEKAMEYARQGEALARELRFPRGEAKAVNMVGVCQLILSRYDESLVSHFRALKLREELKDTTGMMESLINVGNVYYRLAQKEEAVSYYRRGLIYAEKLKSLPGQAMLYNNLGSYYKDHWLETKKREDYHQALSYIQKARKVKEALNDQAGLANVEGLLGDIYLENKEPEKALEAYRRQLALHRKSRNKEGFVLSLGSMADAFLAAGKMTEAALYADSAYAAAKATKSEYLISNTAVIVAAVSAKQKDFQKAYELVVAENERNNEIYADSRQKIREELAVKYQSDQKDELNRQLEQENQSRLATIMRKNKAQLQAFVAIGVLVLLMSIVIWNRQKLKKANLKLREQNRIIEENNQQISAQKEQIEGQAAELTVKNEALETANMIRNKVFSIISHDLRSPLASVDSFLVMIREHELSKEEMAHFADILSDSVEITQKMLDSLLVWAGTQIQGWELKIEEFPVSALVQDNFRLVAKHASEKDITLYGEVPEDLIVHTDRERLTFIVRNIISNAVKFTGSGGQITASWKTGQGGDTLCIRDTGVGMKADALKRLFTQKLNSTDGTAHEKGSGLGMLLSKDFADSLRLRITVESREGEGTSFCIRFPEGVARKNSLSAASGVLV